MVAMNRAAATEMTATYRRREMTEVRKRESDICSHALIHSLYLECFYLNT